MELINTKRRNFIFIFAANAVLATTGGISYFLGEDLKSGDNWSGIIPNGLEFILGNNPKKSGIMLPGINQHRQALKIKTPSKYLNTAFLLSTSLQKKIIGVENHINIPLTDEKLKADSNQNILVLGGPVSTKFTRILCGYIEVPCLKEEGKIIPIIDSNCPLPYYFYVGNEFGYGYWGNELRRAIRWHEDGREEDLKLYGIYKKENNIFIPQPVKGGRAAGDILMVLRVPNPYNKLGNITVIGGLHGYSTENFFGSLAHNMETFLNEVNCEGYEHFQALIPYRMNTDHSVRMNLKGEANWRCEIEKIDPEQFLAYYHNRQLSIF